MLGQSGQGSEHKEQMVSLVNCHQFLKSGPCLKGHVRLMLMGQRLVISVLTLSSSMLLTGSPPCWGRSCLPVASITGRPQSQTARLIGLASAPARL